MKTYLLDILNRYKKFSESLDVEAILCSKSWSVFNDSGCKEIYLFQHDGSLIISVSGEVTNATWKYILVNQSILISTKSASYMLHPAFVDDIIFALQLDGTNQYSFMIDELQRDTFAPKSLSDIEKYFIRRKQLELEKEKQISKEIIIQAIESSLLAACKDEYGKSDNIKVIFDRETGAIGVYAEMEIVEDDLLEDETTQMAFSVADAKYKNIKVGDVIDIEVTPKNFGRIAAQKAKQVVVQKIREEERKVLYVQYLEKEREVITGIVQRYSGRNVCINLGKVDAILMESEQVPGERFRPTEHIKLYVVEVKDTPKGPRITVSRTHPEFVKRLFEEEVTEIQDGTVEIKSIAREAGSRTKIAVTTQIPDVDAVGACVGMNGARVNAIVEELRGEKIDIVNWSESPEVFIENALSPSEVTSVTVDEEEKTARVIVPENQLSLAIGKEGQNARLAAKLTGYKVDIKCEETL